MWASSPTAGRIPQMQCATPRRSNASAGTCALLSGFPTSRYARAAGGRRPQSLHRFARKKKNPHSRCPPPPRPLMEGDDHGTVCRGGAGPGEPGYASWARAWAPRASAMRKPGAHFPGAADNYCVPTESPSRLGGGPNPDRATVMVHWARFAYKYTYVL